MEQNKPEETKKKFSSLRPSLVEDFSHYHEAYDFIFSDNEILNVGITGAYASGKSSVLNTLEQKEYKKKFLYISLASFTTEPNVVDNIAQVQDTSKDTTSFLNELEGEILNQLLHQIDSKKIPKSRFRMIRKKSPESLKKIQKQISAALISVGILVNFLTFYDFSIQIPLFIHALPYIWGILFFLSLGASSFLLYDLLGKSITYLENYCPLKNLSIQGNQIELYDEKEASYFNKYLDEILYLFQECGADIIVFEDIDPYNRNEVFSKLREINFLVNEKIKVQKQNPLRFFYLLRDDVFTSKDRTKFFDFILPIVPVMDSSNSYDQLKLLLEANGVWAKLDQSFLMDVSLYIDDLRLLKNICNEFMIYFPLISKTEQSPNKMLAIIIYKNLFPKDFSQLQMNEGYVHGLFEFKNHLNENITKGKIDELNLIIKVIEREHLESMDELNYIFNRAHEVQALRHLTGSNRINAKQIRTEAIQNGKVESIEKYRVKINELTETLQKLEKEDLHKLITNENIHSVFSEHFPLIAEERFSREEILKSPYSLSLNI